MQSIAVLGAGTMGHGIAQIAAAAGYDVIVRDVNAEALSRGLKSIERNLAKGIELGKVTEKERDETLRRLRLTTELSEVGNPDLIIEAAPEILELKQSLVREVDSLPAHDFIFATNISSLSITEIAKAARRPQSVVGMHFFNPVHLMRLVEIVVGKQTSDAAVASVREVAQQMKKEAIVVRDVPGFASSRTSNATVTIIDLLLLSDLPAFVRKN